MRIQLQQVSSGQVGVNAILEDNVSLDCKNRRHNNFTRNHHYTLSLPSTVGEWGGQAVTSNFHIVPFEKNEGSGYWIISLEATFQKRPKKNWTKPEKPSTEFLS